MDVQPAPVAPAGAVATTSSARSGRWPRRRAWTASSRSPTELPAHVHHRRAAAAAGAENLLSNAVKFTDTGSVAAAGAPAPTDMLFCDADAATTPDRSLRLRGHRHRHRDRRRTSCESSSRRSSRPTARPAASTAAPGLGLSISREIARLLGGAITVRASRARLDVHAVPAGDEYPLRGTATRVGRPTLSDASPIPVARIPLPHRRSEDRRAVYAGHHRCDGAHGADRRRRHPQRLRADQRAGAARPARCCTPRTAARASRLLREHRRRRPRADGHHDAGDGRLRDHGRDPGMLEPSRTCRSSR